MTFAIRLRTLMRHRGIRSQSQLARLSGVSQTSIHRILRASHRGTPSVKVLTLLAQALDISPSWLMLAELPHASATAPLIHDPDEREWCALYRRLHDRERKAVLILARSLGQSTH